MAIQPINNDAALSVLTRNTSSGQTVDVHNEAVKKKSAAGDSVAFSASGEVKADFARIDSTKEAIAAAARSIRHADKAMKGIGEHLTQMKAHLEAIVKNYPPFPQGSDERMKLLRSYNSLRKQIDALTVPPPPPDGTEYASIVGDPSVTGTDGLNITTERGDMFTIKAQEVHSGPTGLDLPLLPDAPGGDATDDQIYQALTKLDAAVATLGEKHSVLAADAQRLLA